MEEPWFHEAQALQVQGLFRLRCRLYDGDPEQGLGGPETSYPRMNNLISEDFSGDFFSGALRVS